MVQLRTVNMSFLGVLLYIFTLLSDTIKFIFATLYPFCLKYFLAREKPCEN